MFFHPLLLYWYTCPKYLCKSLMLRSELQIWPPDLFQLVDCNRKCTISKEDRRSFFFFFFILKLGRNLKVWCSTCSWRETEEQIIFSQTAEKPQNPRAFNERFLWWEEMEAEAEDSAQCKGHKVVVAAGWCNGSCNLLLLYTFPDELKKGLPP